MPSITRAAPQGQLTWGLHVSLAPIWFDPAETLGIITLFMVLCALHDAMVKPMPGELYSPNLAGSWRVSEDNLTYEFTIRNGVKFHNGEPVTAKDVEVLVRALSRCRPCPLGAGSGRGRRSRPAPCPLHAEKTVA